MTDPTSVIAKFCRENKIKVYTYNPVLIKFRNQASSRFDLDYLMAGEK